VRAVTLAMAFSTRFFLDSRARVSFRPRPAARETDCFHSFRFTTAPSSGRWTKS